MPIRVVVVRNHVDRLLLPLLREVHRELGNRRLQIEMARIERAMLDRLQRQFDHLAGRVAVLETPRTILRRFVGRQIDGEVRHMRRGAVFLRRLRSCRRRRVGLDDAVDRVQPVKRGALLARRDIRARLESFCKLGGFHATPLCA